MIDHCAGYLTPKCTSDTAGPRYFRECFQNIKSELGSTSKERNIVGVDNRKHYTYPKMNGHVSGSRQSLDGVKNRSLLKDGGFINGEWVSKSHSSRTFDVIDPATLKKLITLPEMGKHETATAIQAAHEAFKSFKKTSARERARLLRKWSDLCLQNADDLALILCLENGKTLAEAKGEVLYGASFLEWFAGEAERVHGETVPPANLNQRILTVKQPIGVSACLAPWNFPVAMITRKCGAALAAGCTTVWKPAGETPLSALAQAVLAMEAGFPKGSINVVTTLEAVSEVGEELCANKMVKKLSFTGSTRVGKLLMKQCASSVKKLSLELGGNSPMIIFDDAKLDVACDACIMGKFRNAGQTYVSNFLLLGFQNLSNLILDAYQQIVSSFNLAFMTNSPKQWLSVSRSKKSVSELTKE
jgi:succinate-semialdehyde dehydrogenase/glutarate-semialdehyde dehydrogenase